jgi:hypothetical protein
MVLHRPIESTSRMGKSDLAFQVAYAFPTITDLFMRTAAPYLPPHWILNEIVARRGLRIPVTAKLSNGMKMNVILGDRVGEAIRRDGCYEPATTKVAISQLRKDAVFFDLGAHVGQYTLLASPLCHSVHSFEAVPVLVQRQMERGRFPLVSNSPFRARSL